MDSLLIVSFSRLEQDARLRRQIDLFANRYDVVTAGFGPAVQGAPHHIELPVPPSAGLRRRLRAYTEAILLRAKAYRVMYATDPMVRAARGALRGRRFDRVIANDIQTVPLALGLAPASRVHADLHEYYPGLHDDVPAWVRLRQPYYEWLIRSFATRVASVTTVGEGVADAYRGHGIAASIVTNAPELRDGTPSTVHTPIRLVHAGAALPSRRIERMMRAVAAARSDVVLTVHLTPNNPGYLAELQRLADELGPRVRLEPPVPHSRLIEALSEHDVGIHVLPPDVTNQALSLPNKFFDFVQARLAVIVGPTPGMASLVEKHGFGAVTSGFDVEDIERVVDALDRDAVAAWKNAAHAAASTLSAESQLPVWVDAVAALGEGQRARD